ncbi:MAG TPA: response regulator [Polyangiaceae bacterium]|nr:response regulator [Polyangiaceae bacterium]
MTWQRPSATIVERDRSVLLSLQSLLRRRLPGWRLRFFAEPESAMAHIEEEEPHIVIAELDLPGFEGASFLEWVRDRAPSTVRLLLTSYASDAEVLGVAAVAHQLLTKPGDVAGLPAVLESAWGVSSLLRDPSHRDMVAESNDLPPAPSVFMRLASVLDGPEPSAEDVAAVIEQDAALAGRVVQVAQSTLFGARVPPRSVREAVVRLGFELTRGLALTAHLDRIVPRRVDGFDADAFSRRGLRTGMMMRRLASRQDRDQAFLTGIVHGVGDLLFASRRPEQYARMAAAAVTRGVPMAQVMHEELRITGAELGAYLLGLWGFPTRMVAAVGRQHHPKQLLGGPPDACDTVYVARRLVVDPEVAVEIDPPIGANTLDAAFIDEWGGAVRLDAWRHVARSVTGQRKPQARSRTTSGTRPASSVSAPAPWKRQRLAR